MRLVIAEDSVVLRHGLVELLSSNGHEVAAAVRDGDALRAAVAEHQPDAVIVDIRMPPTHTDEGLRAAVVLRQTHPRLGILVFSQYIETRHAAALLAAGARGVGYLLKDRVADIRDFLDSVTRIANGETVLDPEVVTQLMGAARHAKAMASLTARERQVLALMAEGRSNAAIAKTLTITVASVEKNITNIFTRLDLPPSDDDHRRVLAVLRYLEST
jgi:DNA-binding NarL/FixJ family response regulator